MPWVESRRSPGSEMSDAICTLGSFGHAQPLKIESTGIPHTSSSHSGM
jgi:hypothetical protein